MAKRIQYAINETEVYRITGCLSSCERYHYTAIPRSDMKFYRSSRPSLKIAFGFQNGKNEVKEQVNMDLSF